MPELTRHRDASSRVPVLLLLSVVTILTGALAGCRASAAYTNTLDSKEAVAGAVLDAIARRDAARLRALAVTEAEFRTRVWPELPASRPDVGMPIDYVWSDMAFKNRGYLSQLLAEQGGRRLTLEAVEFEGRTTDYGAFRVHAKTRLVVRDEAGARQTIRVFGSLLESGGAWKVFSYVVD